jgi:hypothetical protein
MTDLIDRADSGEILPWDTVVLDVCKPDKPTLNLSAYLKTLPPLRALRLADANPAAAHDTGEQPLITTGAEVVVALRPTQAVRPPLPVVAYTPDARPSYHRPRHRRPVAAWAWLLTGAGLMLLSQAGASLAALAVLR